MTAKELLPVIVVISVLSLLGCAAVAAYVLSCQKRGEGARRSASWVAAGGLDTNHPYCHCVRITNNNPVPSTRGRGSEAFSSRCERHEVQLSASDPKARWRLRERGDDLQPSPPEAGALGDVGLICGQVSVEPDAALGKPDLVGYRWFGGWAHYQPYKTQLSNVEIRYVVYLDEVVGVSRIIVIS
jgi:hypothetical protein